jgi:hypothetical protein
VKRIDDETREAIAAMAEELDTDGWVVSRRALAREFGVSPQTVARVLDGNSARHGSNPPRGTMRHPLGHATIASVIVLLIAWWAWRTSTNVKG